MSSLGYQVQLEDRFRGSLAASWMRASVEELVVGGTGLLEKRHAHFLEEVTGADLAKGQEVIDLLKAEGHHEAGEEIEGLMGVES